MAIEVGELLVQLAADTSEFGKNLESAADDTTSWAENLGSTVTKVLGGVFVGGAVAAAGAVAGIGAAAFNVASDVDEATRHMQASLGLTTAEAERLGDVALGVWSEGFGESIEEAANAVGIVRQQLGALADDELQAVTSGAFAMQDAFGTDVAESISAVTSLVNNFGISSQEAMDLLTVGMQSGLNASGDLIDSINEYSVQFAGGGATATEFFSILETGMAQGTMGTDKAADVFKEFTLRIQDGSQSTSDALTQLGLNTDEILAQLASGGMTASEAFTMVQERLGRVRDQSAQTQVGVALMGTQFEDLGVKAVLAMDSMSDTFVDAAGATQSLYVQYGSFADMVEGSKRQFLAALEPLGEVLLNLANMALPLVKNMFETIKTFIGSFASALGIDFGKISSESDSWGRNIVISLANGMAKAAGAVVQVLMQLGQLIAGWLRPGSAPKLLPDLDAWGAGAATTYMQGWGKADFSVFDNLRNVIGGFVRGLSEDVVPEDMLIPWLNTFNAALAEGVNAFRDVGESGRGVFDELIDSAEFLPESIKEYARSLLDVEIAQAQVEAVTLEWADKYEAALANVESAQASVNAAMADLEAATRDVVAAQDALNAVTEHYDALLAPLNEEMQELQDKKQAIRDEQRLAKLRETLADDQATEAEKALARIEMEEIALRQRMKAIQDEQKEAEDAAKAEVDAAKVREKNAKKAVDAAKSQLEQEKERARAVKEAMDAEIAAAEEAVRMAEEQVDLTRRLIDEQTEANDQYRSQIDLLAGIQEAASDASDSMIEGLAGAASGAGDMVEVLSLAPSTIGEVGAAFETLNIAEAIPAEEVSNSISDIASELTGIFTPLQEDVAGLGALWGTIFGGAIEKIKPLIEGFVDFFKEHWDIIKVVIIGLGAVLAAAGIVAVITAIGGAIATTLASPIALIVGAIVLLAKAWTENWGGIQDKVKEVIKNIEPIFNTIKDWFEKNIPVALEFLRKIWEDVVWPAIEQAIRTAETIITPIWELFKDWLEVTIPAALEILRNLWEDVVWPAIQTAVEIARDIIVPLWEEFNDWLEVWLPEALEYLRNWWEDIVWPAISLALEVARDIIVPIWEIFQDWLEVTIPDALETLRHWWEDIIWPAIQDALEVAWDVIETIWNTLNDWLSTTFPESLEAFRADWQDRIWPAIQEAVETAWTAIELIYNTLKTWLTETLPNAVKDVKEKWDTNWTAIKTAVETAWNRINEIWTSITTWYDNTKTALEDAKNKWDSVWTGIKDAVSNAWDKISEIFTAIKDFANWIKNTVFSLNINFPSIPDAFGLGSPMKIHSALKDFDRYLKSRSFAVGLQFPDVPAVSALATAPVAAQSLGTTINLYDATIQADDPLDFVEQLAAYQSPY